MKEGWTTRWKALFIWLSGYLSIIAFAIVGGYAIVKSEDEELKKTAKQALIVTVIFTAISMFLSLYNAIGVMTDSYYASAAYEAYSILSQLTAIAKIIVFVVLRFRIKYVNDFTRFKLFRIFYKQFFSDFFYYYGLCANVIVRIIRI